MLSVVTVGTSSHGVGPRLSTVAPVTGQACREVRQADSYNRKIIFGDFCLGGLDDKMPFKKKTEVINFNTNKSDKKNTNKGGKDKVVVCCVLFGAVF